MKKILLYPVLCALLIVLSARVAISQSIETDSIVPFSIFFKSGGFVNQPKDVAIQVKQETLKLTVQIGGIINFGGRLSIYIYDPNGKKQDGFSISNTDKDKVTMTMDIVRDKDYDNKQLQSRDSVEKIKNSTKIEGQFLREFTNPLPGKWVIKVGLRNVDDKFKINHIITMKQN